MSQHLPEPPLRGAIDLSALGKPTRNASAQPAAVAPASAANVAVYEVTEASLQDLAQRSTTVPVLMVFTSAESSASGAFVETMRSIVGTYAGRFILATCDVDRELGIAQAFQIAAVPAAMALIGARPAPLFQGTPDESQVREVLDQVLEVAAQAGVTGSVPVGPATASEPQEEPLPPLHQQAFDAVERGDFAGAIDAYDRALRENPKDSLAREGRAQVALIGRTDGLVPSQVRAAAADRPSDVDAQLAVADLDVVGGQVEDAFSRLIDLVRVTFGPEREVIRERLVELFDVVGQSDPRVAAARQKLASALF